MFHTDSTASACAAQWKMRLIRVFGVIYFTTVCAAQAVQDVPPVPSLQLLSSYLEVFPSEKVVFKCEVNSSSDWSLIWLKNKGQITDSDPDISLSADQSVLTITAANPTQSGSYTCKGQHKAKGTTTVESNALQLSVSNLPTPTLKVLTQWQDVFEDEIVALSCEVGNSNWIPTWYKNQVKIDEIKNLMIDDEGTLLNITSASKVHEGEYTCKAELESRAVRSGFSNKAAITVYDNIPKPTLRRAPGYDPMYVGETVDLNCNVDVSSGWEYLWEKGGKTLPATDKIKSLHLALSDEGKYMCSASRSGGTSTEDSEGMQLNVREIPIPSIKQITPWLDVFPEESVQLSCGMDSSSGWTYTWSKDGHQVENDGVVSFDESGSTLSIKSATAAHKGRYMCKGELKERSISRDSDTGLTLTLYSKKPEVTLTQEPDYKMMFPGESVTFSCHINVSSGWEYQWYKDSKQLPASGKEYTVTPVSTTSSGSYSCRAKRGTKQFFTDHSNVKDIQVQAIKPKPLMTQQPNVNKVYIGESVSFKCKVEGSTGWRYTWYKDGAQLSTDGDTLNFRVSLSNKGVYKCSATRDKTKYTTEHSDTRTLTVSEIPIPSIKQITPWLDVFPEESVQLSCGMDSSSGWTYTWSKDGHQVENDGVVSFDESGSTLSIKSATAAHKGRYTCKGELKERSISRDSDTGLTLTLYSKKPEVTLTQEPDYKMMFPGESVTFSCHINVSSGWEYQWYKDSKQLPASGKEYTVTPVSTTSSGSYTCRAKRGTKQFFTDHSNVKDIQVQASKPKPLMTQQPNFNKVYIGETVSFKCKVEGSTGWRYTWYKDGAQLSTDEDTLNFRVSLSNQGVYKCSATRDKTKYTTEHSDTRTLTVSEIPVPVTKRETDWLDVFPTEMVKLSCEMDSNMEVSSDWTYTWYRDKQDVQYNSTISAKPNGTLSITSASTSHRGHYSCSATLKSRIVKSPRSSGLTLTVYDKKPEVILTQKPAYNEMHTGDKVSFICHINVSSGWEYQWFKDESRPQISGENFTIESVGKAHSGLYGCRVKRGQGFISDKSVLTLNIKERPQANIILLTGWSEVFSAVSLELKCGVDGNEYKWNYTWYKEEKQIANVTSQKYTVTPNNDPEQSHYTCKGIRRGRPSYSKPSEKFKTKNLLLKRRVLLSISGLIFFGIIAVLLGCIALRVFRKPADDDEGPEEADLFLSMAQQKGAGVPCPLVEFITDATLTSSSKDGEGNGTICSETTPLPITSQEDQAGTTESTETAETNGGLVSFKQ